MKIKSAVLIATLLLLGILIRFVQIAPTGGGNGAESPDQKFLALASGLYSKRFGGGTHNYCEFEIKTAGGGRIHHIVMDEPPQGMIDWREDGVIQWASNSSSVTYTFKGALLTLNVDQQTLPPK
jgi:hypothetical protein